MRTSSKNRNFIDYYEMSFSKHLRIAEEAGLPADSTDFYSTRTLTKKKIWWNPLTDESRKYLEGLGFALSGENGRVGVERKLHPRRGDHPLYPRFPRNLMFFRLSAEELLTWYSPAAPEVF